MVVDRHRVESGVADAPVHRHHRDPGPDHGLQRRARRPGGHHDQSRQPMREQRPETPRLDRLVAVMQHLHHLEPVARGVALEVLHELREVRARRVGKRYPDQGGLAAAEALREQVRHVVQLGDRLPHPAATLVADVAMTGENV